MFNPAQVLSQVVPDLVYSLVSNMSDPFLQCHCELLFRNLNSPHNGACL